MEHECHAFETMEDQTIDSPKHCNFNETVFRRCTLSGIWEHDNLRGVVYEDCTVTAEYVNCVEV